MAVSENTLAERFVWFFGRIMVLPAVLVLLAFAIFPLIISANLAMSRFALAPGGFKLTFIGFFNFKRLLFTSQQYHMLGTFKPLGAIHWILLLAAVAACLYWLWRYIQAKFSVIGLIGR